MDAFAGSAKQNPLWRELIEIFAETAGEYFETIPTIAALPASDRRLTVMLSGYESNGFIVNALISNFQDFDNFIDYAEALETFTVHAWKSETVASANPTLIQAIGAFRALTEKDEVELRQLLERRAPAEAIRQKASSIAQLISDRHRSAGTVGKRLNTARLDSSSPMFPCSGYISDIVEEELSLIEQVDGRSYGLGLQIGAMQITAGSPLVFPKVHRNAPCPCGSGKKFRFFHRT